MNTKIKSVKEVENAIIAGEFKVEIPKDLPHVEKVKMLNEAQMKANEAFIDAFVEETGFNKVQVAMAFAIAWERGHSSGWQEVFIEMDEIMTFVGDFTKAANK